MKRSILSLVLVVLFLMGFVMVQGNAVCSANVYAGINLSEDPNAPAPEFAGWQIVSLSEDPNDGGDSVAE